MITIIMAAVLSTAILVAACAPRMATQAPERRLQTSENYINGKFHNNTFIRVNSGDSNMFGAVIDFLRGNPNRTPTEKIPALDISKTERSVQDELRVTWLGHSTCLIEIDGQVILTDPMFSDRASPLSFIGPKRFATDRYYTVNDLPKIDIVVISHDHYDHLDRRTIQSLRDKADIFYTPIGVGSRLTRWGIDDRRVVELDWWQESTVGPLTLVLTPTQHFSGRSLTDRNDTLWGSWTILGNRQRVFFSGDSGYFAGFKKIGEKYGPFDVTLLESGAYNEAWADVHMMPEETVQAHIDLQGSVLMPVHWAKFNLALHPWKEPVQRLLHSAGARGVAVATPLIGQAYSPEKDIPREKWWNHAAEKSFEPRGHLLAKEVSARTPGK